ncbi:Os04g0341900 [Oryza sativa Japonica Group]|uniref:Os04g0341900 protein n=3 Tax=Oryza TaxID=4527 RepID=A0A0P0W930_ORYSJ|nr:Os04g0341900 [Oryza sativa Japonica Group]
MAEGADDGDGAPGRSSPAVRVRGGARRPSERGEELAGRPCAERSSHAVLARGRSWSSPVIGSSGGAVGVRVRGGARHLRRQVRRRQELLQGGAGEAQGHPMDGGRAQAVLAGAGQVRQGRLAQHLAQLRHLADADAGGEPRAEVLHTPQLHEPRSSPLQHPRHHQRHRRRRCRAAGPDHRPGQGSPAAALGPQGMKHPGGPPMAMYGGVPMGHPVAGHMVLAAVGTPVMFPPATRRPWPRCTNDETTLAPPWMDMSSISSSSFLDES